MPTTIHDIDSQITERYLEWKSTDEEYQAQALLASGLRAKRESIRDELRRLNREHQLILEDVFSAEDPYDIEEDSQESSPPPAENAVGPGHEPKGAVTIRVIVYLHSCPNGALAAEIYENARVKGSTLNYVKQMGFITQEAKGKPYTLTPKGIEQLQRPDA